MSHRQFREVRLRDFRCFADRQTARLAPLTLLVGENSTGKTSFLAAVQAVWDGAHGSRAPDFRKAPYDLGSFREIVNHRGGRGSVSDSFAIGFKEFGPEERLFDFDVTFESRNAAPAPVATAWRDRSVSIEHRLLAKGRDPRQQYIFKSPDGSWCYEYENISQMPMYTRFFDLLHIAATGDDLSRHMSALDRLEERETGRTSKLATSSLTDYLKPLSGIDARQPSRKDLAAFWILVDRFMRAPPQKSPFASAPIHPGPRRTYDPVNMGADPWGADVPSRFASLQFQDKAEWRALKEKLDAFGRESGLFDDFSVKQLTSIEGGPFQLQVRKFGKRGRKGLKRNLMDVGFGVSQVVPVLAALFQADGPPMCLLQQPELHLHPSAQAALGSLFCRTAEAGRQLIVETHSEYIVDRIRMDLRDRQTALTPDDVSILFFERSDRSARVHSLRFDAQGNVLGAPDGYGQFFMDEVRRSVDL